MITIIQKYASDSYSWLYLFWDSNGSVKLHLWSIVRSLEHVPWYFQFKFIHHGWTRALMPGVNVYHHRRAALMPLKTPANKYFKSASAHLVKVKLTISWLAKENNEVQLC